MRKIVFVMPIFNEVEGINEFISEIHDATRNSFSTNYLCIDDHSTDDSAKVLEQLSRKLDLKYFTNEINMGHGPSTLIALRKSLTYDCDFIVALDGDGQISGRDLLLITQFAVNNTQLDIIEGVRKSRKDPVYRKIVSGFTRIIVKQRSRVKPIDANTPFRVYKPEVLKRILLDVPDKSSIPNLHISAISRILKLNVAEIEITSLPRRGSTTIGTMWRSKSVRLPSKRFIQFCISSALEWHRTKPPLALK
jgi:glycosyltransferase involved in cell wall biosynthesis